MIRNTINVLAALALFVAGNFTFAAFLGAGMRRTYGLSKDSEILILGHSHVMLALDAVMMEKVLEKPISKYTREGVTVAERKLMAEQYLTRHPQGRLKLVIYGVDPYLFNSAGLSMNSYVNFYPMIDDPVISPYLKKNTSRGEYWKQRLLPLCRFHDAAVYSGIAGWLRRSGGSFKSGTLDVEKAREDVRLGKIRKIVMHRQSFEDFRETIRLFTDRNIRVILLNTPIVDLYNAVDPRGHARVEKIFRKAAEDPLVEYWDLNPAYEHEYKLFRDPIHLNRVGQGAVTGTVIGKLRHEIR